MPNRNAVIEEFNARLAEFQANYEWAETNVLARALANTGEMAELIFDPVTAARAMQSLRIVVATPPHRSIDWSRFPQEPTLDWKNEWDELDAFNDTSWSNLMDQAHNLNAFAYYGILPTWDLLDADRDSQAFTDVPGYIHGIIEKLNRFMQMLPKNFDAEELGALERTCLAATARIKFDLDQPMTVHELAAASQVTVKRLQNAVYAKSADAPLVDKDGLIPASSAYRWLEAREFKQSIWREILEVEGWEQSPDTVAAKPAEVDEFLFVPEAKDGSLFSPVACKRPSGHYTIGAKGSEVDYVDYDEALAALSALKSPSWRRPNPKGIFGSVVAERWRRVTRRELFSV